MENNYLKYVITEDVYVVNEPDSPALKEVKKEDLPLSEKHTPELAIKGKSNSKILILTFEETSDFLNTKQESFLKNILSAVKLQLDEIALINLAKNTATTKELTEQLNSEIIITFGLPASLTLPGNKKYEIQSTGSAQILLADSLKEIEADKSLKKELWANLQQLFLK